MTSTMVSVHVVFLGKTLHSYSASLHPGVHWVPANLIPGVTLQRASVANHGKLCIRSRT